MAYTVCAIRENQKLRFPKAHNTLQNTNKFKNFCGSTVNVIFAVRISDTGSNQSKFWQFFKNPANS
jgi:hypothetical protein